MILRVVGTSVLCSVLLAAGASVPVLQGLLDSPIREIAQRGVAIGSPCAHIARTEAAEELLGSGRSPAGYWYAVYSGSHRSRPATISYRCHGGRVTRQEVQASFASGAVAKRRFREQTGEFIRVLGPPELTPYVSLASSSWTVGDVSVSVELVASGPFWELTTVLSASYRVRHSAA